MSITKLSIQNTTYLKVSVLSGALRVLYVLLYTLHCYMYSTMHVEYWCKFFSLVSDGLTPKADVYHSSLNSVLKLSFTCTQCTSKTARLYGRILQQCDICGLARHLKNIATEHTYILYVFVVLPSGGYRYRYSKNHPYSIIN